MGGCGCTCVLQVPPGCLKLPRRQATRRLQLIGHRCINGEEESETGAREEVSGSETIRVKV
jgi:hypothetical protein